MNGPKASATFGKNQTYFPAPVTASSRDIVLPSPDLLYSVCVFDVSQGPVRVTANPQLKSYWSVALYAANSDNFFVINDRKAGDKPVDLWLVSEGANRRWPKSSRRQHGGRHAFQTRLSVDARADRQLRGRARHAWNRPAAHSTAPKFKEPMLAQLLRRSIFTQLLLGAGLGYWLQSAGWVPPWVGLCIALGLPFTVMILVDTWSGILSRSDEPMSDWFKSLLGEYWAGIVVFIFRQPWTTQPPVLLPATGDANRIPVVLVHGYMCNHRIWDDVIPALRARGHAVHAVNLEPLYCSIDRYAPIVEAAVQALLAHSGHKQVALVGHSMGGLAIRAWLRKFGSEHAARVLTLGTPHVGTKIGDALPKSAHTPNGKQMVWESDWLKELAATETDTTRALFRIAITPQDNIVFPQRAQTLDGVPTTVFDGLGHVQLCLDPEVIAWVLAQLAELPLLTSPATLTPQTV